MVSNDDYRETACLTQEVLLEQVKAAGLRNVKKVKDIEKYASDWNDLPVRCQLCAFNEKAIPCPYFNLLAEGSKVCDTYKYVIIKSPK